MSLNVPDCLPCLHEYEHEYATSGCTAHMTRQCPLLFAMTPSGGLHSAYHGIFRAQLNSTTSRGCRWRDGRSRKPRPRPGRYPKRQTPGTFTQADLPSFPFCSSSRSGQQYSLLHLWCWHGPCSSDQNIAHPYFLRNAHRCLAVDRRTPSVWLLAIRHSGTSAVSAKPAVSCSSTKDPHVGSSRSRGRPRSSCAWLQASTQLSLCTMKYR